MRRIVCQCCGRQVVRGNGAPDKYVTYGPITYMVNGVCCAACAKDLDDNGVFHEEY